MDAGEKEIFIEGHPCVVVDSVRMRYRVASSAASDEDAGPSKPRLLRRAVNKPHMVTVQALNELSLVVGIFVFQFSSGAITSGARSIRSNKSIVQAFNFPRAALPIGANVRELLSAVPLILAMLLIVVVLPPAEDITWLWVLVVPAILLQSLFNLGVGLILARIISRVHDVTHLLPFALRAWMYGSAIFYTYERFVTHPEILAVIKLNPLFNVIDIIRDCVLYARVPQWQSWAILAAWALGALAVGLVYFWKGEESYGRG